MLSQLELERLVSNILATSSEAETLDDLGTLVMPLFERLFDTSNSLLYRCDDHRKLVKLGGTMEEAHYRYADYYYSSDPIQGLMRRLNRWILHAPRYPEWKMFLKLPVYTDHARRHDIDNYIHIRLNDFNHNDPGMAGILIARSKRQPDFTDEDGMILARLHPALKALVKRSARMEKQLGFHAIVESMVDLDPRPKIALDLFGKLLWASKRAETLVKLRHGGKETVPDALVHAARKLGALTGKYPISIAPPSFVFIPQEQGTSIRADLRLARTRTGVPFVLAELASPVIPSQLIEVAAQFHLTKAETEVLHLLAKGLADREIGLRLFVSMPTVRTHVGRILNKMGVSSRVQAALLAQGLKPEIKEEEK